MPEYLAPGVYVEETSFRSKPIAGVSTSTTAFVGVTATGPVAAQAGDTAAAAEQRPIPELLTSVGDFERIYGGSRDLTLGGSRVPNYLAHAVRGFFENGGRRLYFARVASGGTAGSVDLAQTASPGRFVSREPGEGGNGTITVRQMTQPAGAAVLNAVPVGSLVRVPGSGEEADTFYVKTGTTEWQDDDGTAVEVPDGAEVVSASVTTTDRDGGQQVFDDLAFHPDHPRFIGTVMGQHPSRRTAQLENRFAFQPATPAPSAFSLHAGLFGSATFDDEGALRATFAITNAGSGSMPDGATFSRALERLRAIEDISIVAAPGSSALTDYRAIRTALITHVSRRRAYEIAVLDLPRGQTIGEAQAERAAIDSHRAAIYYPWIRVTNPNAGATGTREIVVPPSGHLCGLYARNDAERGVHKAPANEIVRGALGFEVNVNMAQQEVLNANGINALRFFPGRGYRVWGARTPSSDTEWRYVSTRRFFNFIEASIDSGTQWVVFEPNGEKLWAKVRQAVSDFLYPQWRAGALLGASPSEAYFVRCDRSTMSQLDLDEGRLICEVGIAPVKPAEFVIFRIGQFTAESRN